VSDEIVLRVRNLRVELTSGEDVVDDVSFDVAKGMVMGLVGESGCGKTSVAMALLNHARQGARITGGEVLLGPDDVLRLPRRQGRAIRGQRISYVPQDPSRSLNSRQRIGRQLDETLRVHGRRTQQSQASLCQMLAAVRLPASNDFLRRYPHQLSGGQQQRILLVMALVCEPEVVVLDEPTTGLDVTTQAHVLEAIARLREVTGSAFVYVTHDLAVLSQSADRIGVMYAGRMMEEADAGTIFTAPAHPYTIRLIASTPRIRDASPRAGIPGTAPRPGDRPSGCPFAPRCDLSTSACTQEIPPIEKIGQGHIVRCLRWREASRQSDELISRGISAIGDPVLSIRAVSARYGSTVVLDNLSLEIGRGECVGLVGESGSGKSTLARCVAGLHEPVTGSVALGGVDVAPTLARRSTSERRLVQLVFQNPDRSLNPRQTVRTQIARPLEIFKLCDATEFDQRVSELLDKVRLPASLAFRYPAELSGGEKQRVAIARALATEPSLLLCDEITSALDVSVQAAVVNLLDELRRVDGLALLFISHDLRVVNWIADRVVVLAQGVICEQGMTKSVLAAPQDPYTRELIAASPELPFSS